MKRSDGNDKGMLNEVLPDPTLVKGATTGSPRERTSAHLSRLLAAATLAVGGAVHADATPPPTPGKDNGKAPEQGNRPPDPPPPRYRVVDPIPPPYLNRRGEGILDLTSTPNADIAVDGVATKQRTPQHKLKLSPGVHAITLTVKKPALSESFTVEIEAGETLKKAIDLRPKEPPKGDRPKPPSRNE